MTGNDADDEDDNEEFKMDKALGSDVDKLVCVLTWTRSSSELANRRPQYSVPAE